MSEGNPGAEFLQQKYQLNKDSGVVSSARRREQRTGETLPLHDYSRRIQNYLDRLNKIINPPPLEGHSSFDRKQRNIGLLKRDLYDQVIIKTEEVPENYFQSILKRQEEEGRPIESIPEETKRNLIDVLIKDQRESLDIWVNYLASPDAKYPDWVKYHAFRSVLVMGRYDKEKKKFTERSKTGKSVGQFPELIRDALSFVCDALVAKQKDNLAGLKYGYGIKPEEKAEFERLLKEGDPNFARLYAWAIDKITPISEELLQQTNGQWVKYPQGSDPKKVVEALAQYGTGWCIRGEGTASEYLSDSDLEIYFSLDQKGKPVVPRIVIVTRGGRIDEVRGVAKEEHWDPYIADVVEQKLTQLPDGLKFKKRVADMQQMTAIHRKCFSVDKKTGVKTYLYPELTKEDILFLYEVEGKIEGFGYQIPDPRIQEVISRRNPEEDMPVVFGCEKNQIARSIKEIKEDTKAYVGSLEPGIFDLISKFNIEHVYTSFPEGRIRIETLEIGGIDFKKVFKELEEKFHIKDALLWNKAKEILERINAGSIQMDEDTMNLLSQLVEKQINISKYALDMLKSPDFTTLKERQQIILVRARVQDLGFKNGVTTAEIIGTEKDIDNHGNKAPFTKGIMTKLGLNLCLPEVGIYQRLKDTSQPLGNWYRIAMKPITDRVGYPRVFGLGRGGDGLWLYGRWADPDDWWSPEYGFVFSLRKYYLFPAPGGVFICWLSRLFFQPHNILPISFNLTAISSYCL